jgi:hypothetical protein
MKGWLFDEKLFREESEKFSISRGDRMRIGEGLDRLKSRFDDKTMYWAGSHKITETRAREGFNQLVFEQILGFSGLLGERLPYSLLPELVFGVSRPDVSVGRFLANSDRIAAVVELKSPGADLEKPQSGKQYQSKITKRQLTAIGQAIEARELANADWALITNMREMYLFHKSGQDHYLWTDLLNLTEDRISEFFYAFGMGGFFAADGTSRLDALKLRVERSIR